MGEFFGALVEPDVPFLRYAFIAGVFASVAFGVVGSYVVARRISYIGGAISHCVLGGIGVALYLQKAGRCTARSPRRSRRRSCWGWSACTPASARTR
jgi:hypothetical protein